MDATRLRRRPRSMPPMLMDRITAGYEGRFGRHRGDRIVEND